MRTKPKLNYLFEADFADGTTYHQGADDESINHPPDAEGNGPSAFRDVQDRMDEVKRFHLVHTETGTRYTVDLTDGHFEVNGVPFFIERKDLPYSDVKLFYLRYTNVDSTVQATANKKGLFNWKKAQEINRAHYVARYVIGYTAQQAGKEINQSIAIAGV